MTTIPKTIHYCWFGKAPLPELALKCIASWKKFLPDFEIKEWNENNFDVDQIPYTSQAYKCKKYAFVSDYARFKILYDHGGIYFDTDVEIIKPLGKILETVPFMACERDYDDIRTIATKFNRGISVAPGLGLAAQPGNHIYKEILLLYQQLSFIEQGSINLTTVVVYTTNILINHGLQNICGIQVVDGITIYPKRYFCPLSADKSDLQIEQETVSIHHFAASWMPPNRKSLIAKIWEFFHLPNTDIRKKLFHHH
jgi:hypothetical protein